MDNSVGLNISIILGKVVEIIIEKVIEKILENHSIPMLEKISSRAKARPGLIRQIQDRLNDLMQKSHPFPDMVYTELKVQTKTQQVMTLSKALQKPRQQLVILEGEPGAGKSFGLLHYATRMVQRAARTPLLNNLLPVFVDLKELKQAFPEPSQPVSAESIEQLVLNALNPTHEADWKEILQKELRHGSWLIIFDSFDEIPAVIQSTRQGQVAHQYADAIRSFLNLRSNCKGIIASRRYNGPERSGWQRYTLLPLDEKQRQTMIQSTGFPTGVAEKVMDDLEKTYVFRGMVKNPLFLSILRENLKNNPTLPGSIHAVYQDFVDQRLRRDEALLSQYYRRTRKEINNGCQIIAYTMINRGLGLNPKISELAAQIASEGIYSRYEVETLIKAIVITKLGYLTNEQSGDANFSFIHRRLQEYFVSCLILKDFEADIPHPRVPVQELLTAGQWREIAVTLFQMQEKPKLAFLYDCAENILREEAQKILVDLGEYYDIEFSSNHLFSWLGIREYSAVDQNVVVQTANSPYLVHLLGILQEGTKGRNTEPPTGLIQIIQQLLSSAYQQRSYKEKALALEFCDLLPIENRVNIFSQEVSTEDDEFKKVYIQNAGKLPAVSKQLHLGIVENLIETVTSGKYSREKIAVRAYLHRLPTSHRYLRTLNHLLWLPFADLLFLLGQLLIFAPLLQSSEKTEFISLVLFFMAMVAISSYLLAVQLIPALQKYQWYNTPLRSIYYALREGFGGFCLLLFFAAGGYSTWRLYSHQPDLQTIANQYETIVLIIASLFGIITCMILMAVPCTYRYLKKYGEVLHPLLWFFTPIIIVGKDWVTKIRELISMFGSLRSKATVFSSRFRPIIERRTEIFAALTRRKIVEFILYSFGMSMLGLIFTLAVASFLSMFASSDGWRMMFQVSEYSGSAYSTILNYAFYGIMAMFSLVILGAAVYRQSREKGLIKSQPNQVDMSGLMRAIATPSEPFLLSGFWNINEVVKVMIEEKKMVADSLETEQFLRHLSMMIQHAHNLKAKYIHYIPKPGMKMSTFDQWLMHFQDECKQDVSVFNEQSLNLIRVWIDAAYASRDTKTSTSVAQNHTCQTEGVKGDSFLNTEGEA